MGWVWKLHEVSAASQLEACLKFSKFVNFQESCENAGHQRRQWKLHSHENVSADRKIRLSIHFPQAFPKLTSTSTRAVKMSLTTRALTAMASRRPSWADCFLSLLECRMMIACKTQTFSRMNLWMNSSATTCCLSRSLLARKFSFFFHASDLFLISF